MLILQDSCKMMLILQDLARLLQESCKIMHNLARFLQELARLTSDSDSGNGSDPFFFLIRIAGPKASVFRFFFGRPKIKELFLTKQNMKM